LEVLHEDILFFDPVFQGSVKGKLAYRQYWDAMFKANSNFKATIVRVYRGQEPDWIAVEYIATGTHTGPIQFVGESEIPPTGKKFRLEICTAIQVEGLKVKIFHNYYDVNHLLRQLGLR
jgi:predicted ester cyclase